MAKEKGRPYILEIFKNISHVGTDLFLIGKSFFLCHAKLHLFLEEKRGKLREM